MHEFDSVSVSTYEAASLAAKLSEKAADGWEVVAIVPAGTDVIAYVKRDGSDATSSTTAADTAAAAGATTAASEPAGWGTAPEAAAAGATWGAAASNDTGGAGSWGSTSTPASDTSSGWGSTAAATAPAAATTPATPATPSVPAGWYHDPAGRFELRYWDGSAWTEHVSRAGQQYTDPPVA